MFTGRRSSSWGGSVSDSIAARRAAARAGGGQARIDAQHARGKQTAHERIAQLLDPETFQEVAPYMAHRQRDFGLETSGTRATASSPDSG